MKITELRLKKYLRYCSGHARTTNLVIWNASLDFYSIIDDSAIIVNVRKAHIQVCFYVRFIF